MTEKDVYIFYNERVKVAYSEIEARGNALPIELLFEINSAFDHLKRYHVDGQSEEEAAQKAYAHLKRGVLDAYKIKLKYFNEEYQKLFSDNDNKCENDNADYIRNAIREKNMITKLATKARMSEGSNNVSDAFDGWYAVSIQIDEFEKKYF